MSTLAIVTPSYGPDLASFRRLHASVVRHTDPSVLHHVIVPSTDVGAFRAVGGDRLRVWSHQQVLPPEIRATDRLARWMRESAWVPRRKAVAAVSTKGMWRPVRGWVLQQILKVAFAEHTEERVLVYLDSDVFLVRDLTLSTFLQDGVVRLYTAEGAIRRDMVAHHRWSQVAHRLLGLEWGDLDTYPDHIAGIVSWDRDLVRAMCARIEQVSGVPWATALARESQFSEWLLYGTFVRALAGERARSFERPTTLRRSHWSTSPLNSDSLAAFLETITPDDLAVHIQSTSRTDDRLLDTITDSLERKDAA